MKPDLNKFPHISEDNLFVCDQCEETFIEPGCRLGRSYLCYRCHYDHPVIQAERMKQRPPFTIGDDECPF